MSRESKTLSHVLRHEPQLLGLELRPGGWVQVDDLLGGMKKAGINMPREALVQLVSENDKKRFTLSDDDRRIRASQGHSVDVDLELAPIEPPAIFLHGTARQTSIPLLLKA